MDSHTFTNSKAAINLTKILNDPECAQYRDRATRILSRWFEYSSEVLTIKNPTVCGGTLDLWRKHFLAWVSDSAFPDNVRSHMENVIVMQYRKCRRVINARAKKERGIRGLPK